MNVDKELLRTELFTLLSAAGDFSDQVEIIYHFLYERQTRVSRTTFINALARFYSLSLDIEFKQAITQELIENYFVARSFGLNVTDAARNVGITKTRLLYGIAGIDLPVDLHKQLLEAELCANSAAQYVAAQAIFNEMKEGNARTALLFLERRFSAQWGKLQDTQIVNNITAATLAVDKSTETRALKAIKTLQNIRKNKQKDIKNEQEPAQESTQENEITTIS